MEKAIREFHTQFAWQPTIVHKELLEAKQKFIVCGMGGSALAAGLSHVRNPERNMIIHRDYGLPPTSAQTVRDRLCITVSYSGNTEETLDAYRTARERGIPLAAITSGGALLERAQADKVPHIVLPKIGIQPRMAIGFMAKALLKLVGDEPALAELTALSETLDPSVFEDEGRALAEALIGKVPVIYASTVNLALAYTWKITFNETGKIPAFCHVFPELNHNEMTGFDMPQNGEPRFENMREGFNAPFAFILLKDPGDDPRVAKRMTILEELFRARDLPVQTLPLSGGSAWEKIFSSILLASWTALATAAHYGLEATRVPMIEEFKKRMAT
jgi:glucose/mannose-6-phosphate isomerase